MKIGRMTVVLDTVYSDWRKLHVYWRDGVDAMEESTINREDVDESIAKNIDTIVNTYWRPVIQRVSQVVEGNGDDLLIREEGEEKYIGNFYKKCVDFRSKNRPDIINTYFMHQVHNAIDIAVCDQKFEGEEDGLRLCQVSFSVHPRKFKDDYIKTTYYDECETLYVTADVKVYRSKNEQCDAARLFDKQKYEIDSIENVFPPCELRPIAYCDQLYETEKKMKRMIEYHINKTRGVLVERCMGE